MDSCAMAHSLGFAQLAHGRKDLHGDLVRIGARFLPDSLMAPYQAV